MKLCKHINGLVQDCSISSANALEILQSRTEPSICPYKLYIESDSILSASNQWLRVTQSISPFNLGELLSYMNWHQGDIANQT